MGGALHRGSLEVTYQHLVIPFGINKDLIHLNLNDSHIEKVSVWA